MPAPPWTSSCEAIATSLRLCEQHERGVIDTLIDALAPRRLLLMLDNCEHLLQPVQCWARSFCAHAASCVSWQPVARVWRLTVRPCGGCHRAPRRTPSPRGPCRNRMHLLWSRSAVSSMVSRQHRPHDGCDDYGAPGPLTDLVSVNPSVLERVPSTPSRSAAPHIGLSSSPVTLRALDLPDDRFSARVGAVPDRHSLPSPCTRVLRTAAVRRCLQLVGGCNSCRRGTSNRR